ncbi:MAG: L-histidine N(alpha)-methyltransferase [Candidatus Woesearchaeota archaeon]|nr:L-histidine N(alpha)-methyltransferase [Candidatus Woesearchaeota archaeon]
MFEKMNIIKMGIMPTKKESKEYVKQGIIPVKFCYPKIGGDIWHKLRRDKRYVIGERELTAFNGSLDNVKEIIEEDPINIVHLGPGDGIEVPLLFDRLNLCGNGKYVGADISGKMIINTFRLNKPYFSNDNSLWYLTDIEIEGNLELICRDIKNKGANRNLILLTNQGVLLSNPRILEFMQKSMDNQDYLFITVEGDCPPKRDEICATYDLAEVRELLSVGLQRAGYDPKKGRFRTVLNEQESRAEVYFKPEMVQSGSMHNKPEILCLTSYKPQTDEFRQRLENAGLHIKFMKFYEDVHTFGVLCSKNR